jgi:disulfide bond formation protein DsbB
LPQLREARGAPRARVAALGAERTSGADVRANPAQAAPAGELALRAGFALALAAALGSLFASEVLGYPPCALCWYQRISMYPLVLVYGVALWTDDRSYARYSAPLCLAGLALAIYHNLLYYGVIPESIAPCQQGVSCTEVQLELWGFVTLPLLSLAAFAGLGALEVLALRRRIPA